MKSWIACAALFLIGCLISLPFNAVLFADDEPTIQSPEIRVLPDANEPITVDQGASINPKMLIVVNDAAGEMPPGERDVYYQSLKLARETPLSTLRDSASKLQDKQRRSNPKYANTTADNFPQFVDLYDHPDVYRGHPVTLRGTIRRLTKFEAAKNAAGITDIYEGWIYTADANSNPAVIHFTSKPEELKLGGDITDEIRVTGYFFKTYSYESQGGPNKAPMLVAGAVEWHPGPRHFVFPAIPVWAYVLITAIVAFVGYGMWKSSLPRKLPGPENVDLSNIAPLPVNSLATHEKLTFR